MFINTNSNSRKLPEYLIFASHDKFKNAPLTKLKLLLIAAITPKKYLTYWDEDIPLLKSINHSANLILIRLLL